MAVNQYKLKILIKQLDAGTITKEDIKDPEYLAEIESLEK